MEKVIKDGMVAILVSPGFGAGWSSFHEDHEELLFHPWIKENLDFENVYCGGARNLEVQWLAIGVPFRIEEYDGSESLLTSEDLNNCA